MRIAEKVEESPISSIFSSLFIFSVSRSSCVICSNAEFSISTKQRSMNCRTKSSKLAVCRHTSCSIWGEKKQPIWTSHTHFHFEAIYSLIFTHPFSFIRNLSRYIQFPLLNLVENNHSWRPYLCQVTGLIDGT